MVSDDLPHIVHGVLYLDHDFEVHHVVARVGEVGGGGGWWRLGRGECPVIR